MAKYIEEACYNLKTFKFLKEIMGKYHIIAEEVFAPGRITPITKGHLRFVFNGDDSFLLSGFPNNCSALILGDIQALFYTDCLNRKYDRMDLVLSFTEEVATKFEYASVFISVTEENIVNELLTRGFVIVHENVNPHSNNHNYFLVKTIEQEEKEEDEDD